jgi:hypothetical protein
MEDIGISLWEGPQKRVFRDFERLHGDESRIVDSPGALRKRAHSI